MKTEIISTENLKPLVDLVLELWEDCSFDEELENYKSIIGSEHQICFLAKDDEEYIAFVLVGIRNNYVEGSQELPVAYIEGIYVKPAYQKKGIAKKLTKMAEDWAKRKGLKQIASDSNTDNTSSIAFHKKIGFNEVERIVCFIKDI
jgi:aminoglycoside 6'-N-acetyltransferase I